MSGLVFSRMPQCGRTSLAIRCMECTTSYGRSYPGRSIKCNLNYSLRLRGTQFSTVKRTSTVFVRVSVQSEVGELGLQLGVFGAYNGANSTMDLSGAWPEPGRQVRSDG